MVEFVIRKKPIVFEVKRSKRQHRPKVNNLAGMLALGSNEQAEMLEDEAESHWEIVESHRFKLTTAVDPVKLTPYLRQCRVIDVQDEDEVLNSLILSTRSRRAGALLDILRTRGYRGYIAFLESLELYYCDLYKLLTGKEPTRRFSTILGVEGQDGLLHFLMNEVMRLQQELAEYKKLRAETSSRASRLEEENRQLKLKGEEMYTYRERFNKMKEERNNYNDELIKMKDENYTLAMKFAQLSEEKNTAVMRSRDLQLEIDQLKHQLNKAEEEYTIERRNSHKLRQDMEQRPGKEALLELEKENECLKSKISELQALAQVCCPSVPVTERAIFDILEHDKYEALEERQELVQRIFALREEVRHTEELRDKYLEEKEELELRSYTLKKDCEMYKQRIGTIILQLEEVERERDQAFSSRDESQTAYAQSLLDKDKYRKQIRELEERSDEQTIRLARSEGRLLALEARQHRNKERALNGDMVLPPYQSLQLLHQMSHTSSDKHHVSRDECSAGSSEESALESDGHSDGRSVLIRRNNVKNKRLAMHKKNGHDNTLPSTSSVLSSMGVVGGGGGVTNSGCFVENGPPPAWNKRKARRKSPSQFFMDANTTEQQNTESFINLQDSLPLRNRMSSIVSMTPEPPCQESIVRRVRESDCRITPRRSSTVSLTEDVEGGSEVSQTMETAPQTIKKAHSPLPEVDKAEEKVQDGDVDKRSYGSCTSSEPVMANSKRVFSEMFSNRPFRPSLMCSNVDERLPGQVHIVTISAKDLQNESKIIGGNDSGLFLQTIQPCSSAESAGLKTGMQILKLEGRIKEDLQEISMENFTKEQTHWTLEQCQGPLKLCVRQNSNGYRKLVMDLETGQAVSGDSFYVRVNLSFGGGQSGLLEVACDEIVHVIDTRHMGRCVWLCTRVNPYTMRDEEEGILLNNHEAQKLLFERILQLLNDFKSEEGIVEELPSDHRRTSLTPSRRGSSTTNVLESFFQMVGNFEASHLKQAIRNEHIHLVMTPRRTSQDQFHESSGEPNAEQRTCPTPYTLVQPCRPPCSRPVIVVPRVVARLLYPRLLGPFSDYMTCTVGMYSCAGLDQSKYNGTCRAHILASCIHSEQKYNC
uniref:CARD domain-containing protein n=1 Tax=Eptatretus burgeri TaxID=7764 RepID=A0A8C4R7Q0_EPTBU